MSFLVTYIAVIVTSCQLSHDMLKVIATRRSPPRSNAHCILISLRPYTDNQLVRIMESLFRKRKATFSVPVSASLASLEGGEGDEQFSKLCEQALPFITLKTRHVDEIWAYVSAVWMRQRRRVSDGASVVSARGRGTKRTRSGITDGGSTPRIKHTIEDDVAVILMQPVPHCGSIFDGSFAPSTLAVESSEMAGHHLTLAMDSRVPLTVSTSKSLFIIL